MILLWLAGMRQNLDHPMLKDLSMQSLLVMSQMNDSTVVVVNPMSILYSGRGHGDLVMDPLWLESFWFRSVCFTYCVDKYLRGNQSSLHYKKMPYYNGHKTTLRPTFSKSGLSTTHYQNNRCRILGSSANSFCR